MFKTKQPALGAPARVAAGLPAIAKTMQVAFTEMGVVRGLGTLLRVNQVDGFDCMGCAWPDPAERSVAEFCENGAKAVAEEATTRRAGPSFFREHSVADLLAESDYELGKHGRITHPLILREGATHYEPIAWPEAFAAIAAELNALESPDQAAFYTSGRTSNEAAFLYQLFVRQFGTNNLPDCSNMCHESSGAALNEAIGVSKGTVTLEDFDKAEAIFILGQNPGTNHPRMLTTLASAAKRGCRIVSINPLREAGLVAFRNPQRPLDLLGGKTPIACLHLPVRINGDLPLLKGIMKEMLAAGALDQGFIDAHTTGFVEFRGALERVSWSDIVSQSGIARDEIRAAARIAIESKATICCWAMGLTQHKNAVATIQEVVNFLLLGGNMGKPGAGACPVRGHSNVQGDRTMGIYDKPAAGFLDALEREFGFHAPRSNGFDTVEAIHAMHDGRVKIFFALGGNFLSATPDTEFTAQALRRCRLTAYVSTKLNRAHLVTGKTAMILPCLGRTEEDVQASGAQFVTVEDSMSMVHASRGRLTPASSHLLSEPAIVAELAQATLGARSNVDWRGLVEDYDRVRERIARVLPGFTEFNARVRAPGGFYLGNAAGERRFETATGKARFTVHPLSPVEAGPGEFILMTIRSHDQYNTTIYGLDDRYRGVRHGRRVVFLNPADAEALGDVVDLISMYDGVERQALGFTVAPYEIPLGCAAAYFPEANVLVPTQSVADKSNTPASKSVVIRIRRSAV